jgi:hypothetical protein
MIQIDGIDDILVPGGGKDVKADALLGKRLEDVDVSQLMSAAVKFPVKREYEVGRVVPILEEVNDGSDDWL